MSTCLNLGQGNPDYQPKGVDYVVQELAKISNCDSSTYQLHQYARSYVKFEQKYNIKIGTARKLKITHLNAFSKIRVIHV